MRYMPEHEALNQYDEMLDDCYGDIDICGLQYNASNALKRVDQVAYSCGFNDWCDANCITTDWSEHCDPCSECGEHMGDKVHHGHDETVLLCEDCHLAWLDNNEENE